MSPSLDFLTSDNELMSLMGRDHVEKGQDTTISDYVDLGKGEEAGAATRRVKADLISYVFVVSVFKMFGFCFISHHKTDWLQKRMLFISAGE